MTSAFGSKQRKAILDRHLGRPAIQADVTPERAVLPTVVFQALIATARRRALEPIMLENVEAENSADQ